MSNLQNISLTSVALGGNQTKYHRHLVIQKLIFSLASGKLINVDCIAYSHQTQYQLRITPTIFFIYACASGIT